MRTTIATLILFGTSILMGYLGINIWVSLIPIYLFLIGSAALTAHYYMEKKREQVMVRNKMIDNSNKFAESFGIEKNKHGKINLKDRYIINKKIDEAFDEKAFIEEMRKPKLRKV